MVKVVYIHGHSNGWSHPGGYVMVIFRMMKMFMVMGMNKFLVKILVLVMFMVMGFV